MWFRKRDTIIPMSGYGQYMFDLALKLNTQDTELINASHEAYCAQCGVQYSREALAHLHLFGPGSMFSSVMIVSATKEGNDLRSGRCPYCGHDKMRMVQVKASRGGV